MQPRTAAILIAGLTFLCCYLRSFVSGDVPFLFWGDQLGFATNATRMLAGQIPYRDYFEFLTPGTELAYASLFKLFGVSIWIPNLVMACLAAATAWLMTLCAARVVRGAFVLLPGVLLCGFVLYGSLDATHHWFSTALVMAALLVLVDGTTMRRVAVAGALCGLTASFTQTKGATVTVGFLIYLLWTARWGTGWASAVWRKCLLLCGAAFAVFAAINGPFIYAAGWRKWVECVIVFPLRYYPSVPLNNWRAPWVDFQVRTGALKWVCVPFLYVAVPLACVWALAVMRRWKSDREDVWKSRLVLVAITSVAMFLAVAPSLNIKRISSVSPPAMILLAWLLSGGRRKRLFAAGMAAVSLAIAVAMPIRTQVRRWSYVGLPAGKAAIPEPGEPEVYRWMVEHTRPGQTYFGMPPMYLPLKLWNPTPIEAPGPSEYGRPEQIAAVIDGLEAARTPLLLLRRSMYVPYLLGYSADHLRPFQDYLYKNYRCVKTFSTGDEVWVRVEPQSDTR